MDLDDSMTGSTASSTPGTASAAAAAEFDEEDNLFPDSTNPSGRPRTPVNDQVSTSIPGELSPPRSTKPKSSQSQSQTQANTHSRVLRSVNGSTIAAGGGSGFYGQTNPMNPDGDVLDQQQQQLPQQRDDRPGAGWKNKKAQEDMQRAWDGVVDRDFSLREFGDVVMLGKQQLQQIAQHHR